jgi:hypothetical protein
LGSLPRAGRAEQQDGAELLHVGFG